MKTAFFLLAWLYAGALFGQKHSYNAQIYTESGYNLPRKKCKKRKNREDCFRIKAQVVLMPSLKLGYLAVLWCPDLESSFSVSAINFFKYEYDNKNRIVFDKRPYVLMFNDTYEPDLDTGEIDSCLTYSLLIYKGEPNFVQQEARSLEKLVLQFADTTFVLNLANPASWPSDYICEASDTKVKTKKIIKGIALGENMPLFPLSFNRREIVAVYLHSLEKNLTIRKGLRGRYISMREIRENFPENSLYFQHPYKKIRRLRFHPKYTIFNIYEFTYNGHYYYYLDDNTQINKNNFDIFEIPQK